MESYRIGLGSMHGVKAGNIVGAIANEIGLDSEYIGKVDIHDDHSIVDLPTGMPNDVFQTLKKVRIVGKPIQITKMDAAEKKAGKTGHGKSGKPKTAKHKKKHAGKFKSRT
jgi:ATP-dependent RNA helicase DeaD